MELEKIRQTIEKDFSAKNKAREKALIHSRKTIQLSGNAIRSIHRNEIEKAKKMIKEARNKISEAAKGLKGFSDIYYAGFMQNAEKEYVEAEATLALVTGKVLPEPNTLNVGYAQYLNGLGEAVGELRRHILDLIRHGELEKADRLLDSADDIFYLMASFDYPDAITYSLRRTTDTTRSIMEKTRGDLTTAIRQKSLRESISELQEKIKAENK
ncbi:MAG: haloacid dehalogenase [Actinobacteria bacterium]|nr:MAG: haloacid dehalogenase [Actinomycetota bacterium]